jgi:hypothetical protein
MWRTPPLSHLIALTDDVGVIQHAVLDVPNRSTGYCTDDVARAFMVAIRAAEHESSRPTAVALARTYLSFLHDAQLPDGRFHNFIGYDRRWLDEAGSEDSFGRAVWALGFGLRFAPTPSWRTLCGELLERALPNVDRLTHVRARVLASLGLVQASLAADRRMPVVERCLRAVGDDLRARWASESADGWNWFEDTLTYDNARLPEAAIRIGSVLGDPELVEIGLRSLDFYVSIVVEAGIFVPIGNQGWYRRGGPRARYAQQPLEAAALVDAALAAHEANGQAQYLRLAEIGLEWYYGRNSRDTVLATGGGCFDGLEELGVNHNMGAESTLAYLASAYALATPGAGVLHIAR